MSISSLSTYNRWMNEGVKASVINMFSNSSSNIASDSTDKKTGHDDASNTPYFFPLEERRIGGIGCFKVPTAQQLLKSAKYDLFYMLD